MFSVRNWAVFVLLGIVATPAAAYVEHIRHYTPEKKSAESIQKLAFVLNKSVGNPEGPTRFYIRDVRVALDVDPGSDLPTPKLLEQPGALALTFKADDIQWTIAPDSCKQNEKLINKSWLFCAVGDAGEGFALEPKLTGNAPSFALHFGRVWNGSRDQVQVSVTNGESAALFMNEKLEETVVNRLIVADETRDLVTIEFSDGPIPSL